MRKRSLVLAALVLGGVLVVTSLAIAAGGKKNLKSGDLVGFEENPDISTAATGSFRVTLDDDARTLTYRLTYSGLEGTVVQAHIHFGKTAVNGGITVFLCGTGTGGTAGPAGTPTCPASGTVTRTVTAADILAPVAGGVAQGIEAMNYEELAAAMRAGHTYANVHSSKWPTGEIRAQIDGKNNDDD
jgi:urease alpha subunit